jgi:hypothetical protein
MSISNNAATTSPQSGQRHSGMAINAHNANGSAHSLRIRSSATGARARCR